MIKLYLLLIVLGLLGGAGYGAYYYYKDTQERIQTLTENNVKLATAKAIQDNTIKTMEEDRNKFQKLNTELQTRLDIANTYRDTLIDRLRKSNLVALSIKDPKLAEEKINNGTKKLLESLEIISGAAPASPAK
jgi:hypothetical protein